MTIFSNNAGLVPFVPTKQYLEFKETCDYLRKKRAMGLVHGEAGAGKSRAARRYAEEQGSMSVNSESPVFCLQLEQTDKTDRAFYNALVAAIIRQPPENTTATVASNEAKRLLTKYQYELLIIDEFQFLQDSGLEAVRTLWDKLQIPMIFITMTEFIGKLRMPKYKQFHSRIIKVLPFDTLTTKQVKEKLLPNLETHSHLSFSPTQDDADKIVETLFKVTGGNFRDIIKIRTYAVAQL
jgi:type II secretory pathway predicted ATPase ExeA